ncbi:putative NBD/HSP70 family sugar kinase [Haloactinopolyspora alba]|uniref:Putative NBD/HSP70 family sugar kinase n=1 Tax=Haloactinopolyspora alba TaxID=648780 RepID=A0A2P8E0Z2_9ACTN|nr:ROK family transcriptional regulator [Haloactinopolyspora alba]PSL03140.1 putative NBD/HSP70 family sugar kinase [Haloactinopolyspora alba]
MNDRSALDLLLHEGPMTRVELGKRTGLSKVTASQLLARLQERSLVEVVGSRSTGRGPSAELYGLRPDCSYSVGVELRPDRVTAAAADVTGTVVGRVERAVGGSADPKQLIHDTTVAVAREGGVVADAVDAVVIGMPGVVDPETGDIELSFDLPGWHRGLRQALAADLGCGVTFDNDVNLAAVAEREVGAARDVDDMVLLWVGRGVGLAVVLSGHLHRGATGAAGEIGYLPMPGVPSRADVDRPAKGAFQALVGAGAVAELAARHGIVADGAAAAVAAALAGGDAAEGFLHELVERLALGVASVCAVVDPALVVVTGEVGAAGGERLCAMVAEAVRHIAPVHPQVAPTAVADGPVLRGAVIRAVEQARDELFTVD